MTLGIITLHIRIPGASSLKEKRGRVKPLVNRLHREFNVSAAETGFHDSWQDSLISCAFISNQTQFTQKTLQKIPFWIEQHWPDLLIVEETIEMI